jgi:uncharacterized protein
MSTVLVKPVGDRCNLCCTYCFYHPGTGRDDGVMEEGTLAAMTRGFLAEGDSPVVFAWQGGEPTLAGVDFYRRALDLQDRFRQGGQTIANTFQTNGVLIDEEWAAFFARHRFLVGLSIDGPAELHDRMRRSASGAPSHDRAARAWNLLRQSGCETNVLCVVHRGNQGRPEAVYRHLSCELGADHLQFIPCVEWAGRGELASYALRPGEYGRFLVRLFDLWAGESERAVSVKLFDDLVLFLAGRPMRDCMHRATCDSHLVVEQDGSVYPCDFFVREEYRLGTVLECTVAQLREAAPALAFRDLKRRHRPEGCAGCRHVEICQGGCCKFWLAEKEGGFRQHLCGDLLRFFDHCRGRLEEMAVAVRGRWQDWGAACSQG